jgi:hypothetical protein
MNAEVAQDPPAFVGFAGAVIASIRRLHHVYLDAIDRGKGPIEFTFSDGRVLRLDAGPDGEALAIFTRPWVDPFQSPENAEFVARSGKWTEFDVSADSPYSGLILSPVTDFVPIRSPSGKLVGVVVVTLAGSLKIETHGADEIWVTSTNAE